MTYEDDALQALRTRLAGLDPMPASLSVDPPTSPRAHELLERAMLTTEQTPNTASPSRWRGPAALAATAAAVVAVGAGAVFLGVGDSATPTKARTSLALKAAGGGPAMNTCIMFSVDILKDMPLAFAGTATSVSADSVSLDVTHWYKGGTADVVTVATPVTSEGPGEFVQGSKYLVTATDGTVNGCGYTGEATPDLQKYFDQAFAP